MIFLIEVAALAVIDKVFKCNVDENQDLAMRYHVMSIPTLVLFKGGEEAARTVGAMPKPRLVEEISRNL